LAELPDRIGLNFTSSTGFWRRKPAIRYSSTSGGAGTIAENVMAGSGADSRLRLPFCRPGGRLPIQDRAAGGARHDVDGRAGCSLHHLPGFARPHERGRSRPHLPVLHFARGSARRILAGWLPYLSGRLFAQVG